MANYKVKYSCVLDKHGAPRLRDETVSEADLADVQRLLDLDAIEAVATPEGGTETGSKAPESGTETGSKAPESGTETGSKGKGK